MVLREKLGMGLCSRGYGSAREAGPARREESWAIEEEAQRVLEGPQRGNGGYWRGCGGCRVMVRVRVRWIDAMRAEYSYRCG